MTSSLIMLQDPYLVVTKKPPGVFVHRPEFWGRGESPFLQRIRRIVGQPLFPVHRLDRATSGLLMFGLSSEAAAALSGLFADRRITKSYSAIVRGFAPRQATIDVPLKPRLKPGRERRPPQDAETRIESLEYFELPMQSDRYRQVDTRICEHFRGRDDGIRYADTSITSIIPSWEIPVTAITPKTAFFEPTFSCSR